MAAGNSPYPSLPSSARLQFDVPSQLFKMARGERQSWRKIISRKLEARDRVEWHCFRDIIREHNKLFENADTAKSRVVQLEVQVAQIQQEKLELHRRAQESSSVRGGAGVVVGGSEKVASLEQKLFKLQEELTELHRQKGENAQKLMELNNTLRQKEQELLAKEGELHDLSNNLEEVDRARQRLEQTVTELEAAKQMVKDEHQALHLAYVTLDEKYRKVQAENEDLVTRWMAQKAKDADKVNAENELQLRIRHEKQKNLLIDAAKEPVDAHEGEVNSARFSISGRLFVTGGADRKVNVWEQVNGNYTIKGVMHGCNAGVMSVQTDPQEKLVLAGSHEGTCRVWTLADQRLRHTLTGHSQKVMAAKFFGAATKVVSGGHDRTLKIWDLRSKACTRTIFAGSSCNDIVINEGFGSQVVSGHLDKTVRFWDVRSDNQSSVGEITLQGKITSLDLSPDMNYMLASARDDTVKLLDLRMNQVMSTCSADGFKVAVDYTRASFSSSVVVCAWHPDGSSLISCDRNKRAIIWTNRY
ncbi:hypothetical protein pdam_00020029 [Pocillopora damicornis]|uniref:Autophagy-related protein 16 domain-containing protein n=1 Tax=Pocillopora damicornis TaxID=46731 RepID=A0A3M6T977_POCDA|nr:hypothetical protein pdam_00020029 [Pocillopora damicornis]